MAPLSARLQCVVLENTPDYPPLSDGSRIDAELKYLCVNTSFGLVTGGAN
mgnify:CR=1 FL=1